jgi:hypothetical protein
MQFIELTQFILACSSVVTPTIAVIGFVELHSKNKNLEDKINVIHTATNSMKDELVAEVRSSSLAKGRLNKEEEIDKETQDIKRRTRAKTLARRVRS